ncbi:MAG: aldose 1-epimerase family protein [Chloroflexota bacterium]
MHLWGRDYTRDALLRRVGRLAQVGGVDAAVLDDGPERSVRALHFTGAAGLSCTVLPDRGMDISALAWHGIPLSWLNNVGRPAPGLALETDAGFPRSFIGGMLTTCGLTNFGPGGEEGGEQLSMHGPATYLPASQVAWGERWEGDRCILFARGITRQARLFGEDLTLRRELSMDLDGATLTVEDVVKNEGWASSPHMILYHCNIGFPLLDDGAQLHGHFASLTPRDAEAARGLAGFAHVEEPQAGFKEQVFITEPEADDAGMRQVTLWNPLLAGGLGLRLRWDAETLPWMFAWRQFGEGAYVLGLEPANCPVITGRADARANGTLPFLAPQEERRYRLRFTVITEPNFS